jgi:hypothetical protein
MACRAFQLNEDKGSTVWNAYLAKTHEDSVCAVLITSWLIKPYYDEKLALKIVELVQNSK